MRWSKGKREKRYKKRAEERERKTKFHKIFLWWPRNIEDQEVWLEWAERRWVEGEFKRIERAGMFGSDIFCDTSRWEYRLIPKEE